MNHTLLPESEQKFLERTYKVRLITVALVAISCAGLIGLATLIPTYVFSKTALRTQNKSSNITTPADDTGAAIIREELSKDASVLSAVSTYVQEEKFSPYLRDIVRLRKDLSISSFSFSTSDKGKKSLILRGIAPTRDALLAFSARLEEEPTIEKVDLPVSELTKSVSLPFSLNITYKAL